MRDLSRNQTRPLKGQWGLRLVALLASTGVLAAGCQSDTTTSGPISIEAIAFATPTSASTPTPDEPAPNERVTEPGMGVARAPLPAAAPRRQVIAAEPTETPEPTPTPQPTATPQPRPKDELLEEELETIPSRQPGDAAASSDESPQPFVQSEGQSEPNADDSSSPATPPSAPTNGDDADSTAETADSATTPARTTDDAVAVWTNNGLLLPGVRTDDDTWLITTPCGNEAELASATLADSPRVLLDPGHGGDESGTVTTGGIAEKDLNLRIAKRVLQHLEDANISAVLLRDRDVRITVPVRSAITNALRPELFVSIHHNGGATTESQDPPVEVFHQHDSREAKRMAGLLYESLRTELAGFSYQWPANSFAGAQPRFNGEGEDLYGVLRRSDVPAVLSEAFYLDDATGDIIAGDVKVLEAEALAIATSISRYLETDDFGSGFVKGQQMTLLAPGSGGASGCVDPDLTK